VRDPPKDTCSHACRQSFSPFAVAGRLTIAVRKFVGLYRVTVNGKAGTMLSSDPSETQCQEAA
jgi:hypothetical protein